MKFSIREESAGNFLVHVQNIAWSIETSLHIYALPIDKRTQPHYAETTQHHFSKHKKLLLALVWNNFLCLNYSSYGSFWNYPSNAMIYKVINKEKKHNAQRFYLNYCCTEHIALDQGWSTSASRATVALCSIWYWLFSISQKKLYVTNCTDCCIW